MITDIDCRSEIGPDLDRTKLKNYWSEYFSFAHDTPDLHSLTESALQFELDQVRNDPRLFIDAQQAISAILTRFGSQHKFHRTFNELFSFKPSHVLGMQLYALVARDSDWWVYIPTQHAGHAFPHATYFMPREDARYIRLTRMLP